MYVCMYTDFKMATRFYFPIFLYDLMCLILDLFLSTGRNFVLKFLRIFKVFKLAILSISWVQSFYAYHKQISTVALVSVEFIIFFLQQNLSLPKLTVFLFFFFFWVQIKRREGLLVCKKEDYLAVLNTKIRQMIYVDCH